MTDDEHLRRTIKFEDIDVEDEAETEAENLLDGLAETSEHVDEMTNPFRPALRPEQTVKTNVPEDLLEKSRAGSPSRSSRGATRKVPTWMQFYVTVDGRGRIVIDAHGAGFEPGDRVQVLVRPEDE